MYTYKIYLLPLFVLLTTLLTHSTVFAIGSIDIERGESVSITWNVSGDPSCIGGLGNASNPAIYPDNSPYDTAYDVWQGSGRSTAGSLSLGSLLGNSGASFAVSQKYVFTCTSFPGGATDFSTVNIHECSTVSTSGTTWNGTARRCMYPDLTVTNSGPASGASFVENQSITFTGVVSASSSAPASQGGWADLEIDWNSDGSNHDVNYNAYSGNKLGSFTVGQSKNLSYTLSSPLPIGTHRYRFNVDTVNELNEGGYETNRSAWVSFTVVGAVAGSCGTAARTYAANETAYVGTYCASGTVSPASPAFPQAGLSGSWTCTGNTGAPVSCTAPRVPDTPIVTESCDASGTTGTLSWGATGNTSSYSLRFDDTTNGPCAGPDTWFCPASGDQKNDGYVGTSKAYTIVPDRTYNYWMWSVGTNGYTSAPTPVIVGSCPSPKPDLVPTTPTVLPAGNIQQGTPITVSTGNIINSGTADAAGYKVTFEVDRNNDNVSDYTITPVDIVGTTVVGSSKSTSLNWTPPGTDPVGTYRVRYIVNQPVTITESNTTNNISPWTSFPVVAAYTCGASIPTNAAAWDAEESVSLSGPVNWTYAALDTGTKCEYQCNASFFWDGDSCEQPNLKSNQKPWMHTSDNLNQGDPDGVRFRGQVRNTTSVPVSGTFSNVYTYLWDSGKGGQLGATTSMSQASFTTTPGNANVPWSQPLFLDGSGTLQIRHCTDADSTIAESDETDQCQSQTFTVIPAPTVTLFKVCAGTKCANMGDTLMDVEPNAALTIEWNAEHADSCNAVSGNGFSTGGALNGTDDAVAPNQSDASEIYQIFCDKAGFAPFEAQVTVDTRTVNVNLQAEPSIVNVDNSVTLKWNTDGIDEAECEIRGGGIVIESATLKGTDATNFTGEMSVSDIKGRTLFTLSCLADSAVEYETVELIPERDDG